MSGSTDYRENEKLPKIDKLALRGKIAKFLSIPRSFSLLRWKLQNLPEMVKINIWKKIYVSDYFEIFLTQPDRSLVLRNFDFSFSAKRFHILFCKVWVINLRIVNKLPTVILSLARSRLAQQYEISVELASTLKNNSHPHKRLTDLLDTFLECSDNA